MLCKDFYQNIQLRNRGAHTCHCTVTIETPTGTGINTRLIISGLQDKNRRQQQYIQNIHHRRRFVLAVLTYCYAPAHSCSRAIPCEDRALSIRGFPRPAPCREGCKGFLENRFCSPGRHSETSAILWIQNAISSHQKYISRKENLCIPWILCEKK